MMTIVKVMGVVVGVRKEGRWEASIFLNKRKSGNEK